MKELLARVAAVRQRLRLGRKSRLDDLCSRVRVPILPLCFTTKRTDGQDAWMRDEELGFAGDFGPVFGGVVGGLARDRARAFDYFWRCSIAPDRWVLLFGGPTAMIVYLSDPIGFYPYKLCDIRVHRGRARTALRRTPRALSTSLALDPGDRQAFRALAHRVPDDALDSSWIDRAHSL
jgi:hypothetical protein